MFCNTVSIYRIVWSFIQVFIVPLRYVLFPRRVRIGLNLRCIRPWSFRTCFHVRAWEYYNNFSMQSGHFLTHSPLSWCPAPITVIFLSLCLIYLPFFGIPWRAWISQCKLNFKSHPKKIDDDRSNSVTIQESNYSMQQGRLGASPAQLIMRWIRLDHSVWQTEVAPPPQPPFHPPSKI